MKEARHVLDLDARFRVLDQLIQRASRLVSGEKDEEEGRESVKVGDLGLISSLKAAAVASAAELAPPAQSQAQRMFPLFEFSFFFASFPLGEILMGFEGISGFC